MSWDIFKEVSEAIDFVERGGKGSGNWGHRGRKGKRGGSLPSKGGGGRARPVPGIFPASQENMRVSAKDAGAAVANTIRPLENRGERTGALTGKGFTKNEASRLVTAYEKGGAYGSSMGNTIREIGYDRGFWVHGGKLPERVADKLITRDTKKYGFVSGDTLQKMKKSGIDPKGRGIKVRPAGKEKPIPYEEWVASKK